MFTNSTKDEVETIIVDGVLLMFRSTEGTPLWSGPIVDKEVFLDSATTVQAILNGTFTSPEVMDNHTVVMLKLLQKVEAVISA